MSTAGIPVLGSVTLSGATSIQRKERDYIIEHQIAGKDGGLVERVGSASTRWEIKGFLREANADANYQSLIGLLGKTSNLSIPTFGSGYFLAASGTIVFVESFGGNWIPGYGYPRYDYNLKLVATSTASTTPIAGVFRQVQILTADGAFAGGFGTAPLTNPAAAGNLIFFIVSVASGSNIAISGISVSDNNSNTWTIDAIENNSPATTIGAAMTLIASCTNQSLKAGYAVSLNATFPAGAGTVSFALIEATPTLDRTVKTTTVTGGIINNYPVAIAASNVITFSATAAALGAGALAAFTGTDIHHDAGFVTEIGSGTGTYANNTGTPVSNAKAVVSCAYG